MREKRKKAEALITLRKKFTAISINHYLSFIDIFQNFIQFAFKITNAWA